MIATRKPRVQIPPAPLKPWSGRFSASSLRSPDSRSCDLALHRRSRRSALEAPLRLRGAFSLGLTSFIDQLRDRIERISRKPRKRGRHRRLTTSPTPTGKSSLRTSHLTRGFTGSNPFGSSEPWFRTKTESVGGDHDATAEDCGSVSRSWWGPVARLRIVFVRHGC